MKQKIEKDWLFLTAETPEEAELLRKIYEQTIILVSQGIRTTPEKPTEYGFSMYLRGRLK